MTLIEAFSCGVPVIGPRLGGIGEVLHDGQSGLLFEPGNPEDLAAKVGELASDRGLRDRLGRGARSRFESHYTAKRNLELMIQTFESVLE